MPSSFRSTRRPHPSLTRRHLLAISAGGFTAAFLAACGGSSNDEAASSTSVPESGTSVERLTNATYTYAPKTGKSRDAMTVGVAGLPAGMDPANELSNVGTRVTYSVYDTLVRRDFLDDNKLKPALAASWERADDLTLTAKLRTGVTFHNGDPMTAEDVKYTFERILRPDSTLADAQGYFDTFEAIEIVDPATLRIKTKAPDPLVEKRIASWASWIVPRAHIERTGGDKEFGQHGMGTGPYKVARFTADDRLVLERYDGHWEEKPSLRQLTFRVIPETAARTTALVTGEVQIITNVPPDQVKTLQETSGVEIRDIPLANAHVLSYSANHPVLQNEKLRQAMNLGIDRRLLIDTLWNGRAVQMRSHQFEEYGPLFNASRPFTPYDPVKAKALVAESGYKGDVITYRTQADYYTNGLQAGQAIVEMWRQIGVNAEIKLVGAGDKEVPTERMVANWSNSSRLADPDGSLWVAWGNKTSIQKNYWTPADPEFNRLGVEARSVLDQQRRTENYQQMLDIWEKEAPGTILYIPVENYGVSKDVNWSPYPFYYMDLRAYNLSFNK
jgi:peptide/nickel transport system substrate-binding protein